MAKKTTRSTAEQEVENEPKKIVLIVSEVMVVKPTKKDYLD